MRELQLSQKWVEQKVQHLTAQLCAVQGKQWLEEGQLLFVMVKGPTMNDENCGQGVGVCLDDGVECSWWVFERAMGVVQLHDTLDGHAVDQTLESQMEVAERNHVWDGGVTCLQHQRWMG